MLAVVELLLHKQWQRACGFFEVVAGALSSNPDLAVERAADYHIAPERSSKMAEMEAGRDDGVELVMITTPNHVHYPAAQQFINTGVAICAINLS